VAGLAAAAAAVGYVPPATAGTTPFAEGPTAGPVLAGEEAVWVEGRADTGLAVRVARPGADARTLWSSSREPGRCHYTDTLRASSGRVVLVYREGRLEQSGCFSDGTQTILLNTDGTPAPNVDPPSEPGRFNCAPTSASLDGDVLAVARLNCTPSDIFLYDARTGAELQHLTLARRGEEHIDHGSLVNVNGRFVALHARHYRDGAIVVYDRTTGAEVYRVPVRPFIGSDPPVNYEMRLDLDLDGTVVAAFQNYDNFGAPPTLVWASPLAPEPHVIPTDFPMLPQGVFGQELAVASGLVALRRPAAREFAVIDLAGTTVNVFDRYRGISPEHRIPSQVNGVDFDGRRLAWFNDAVRNEAFPVLAPAVAGAPLPSVPRRCEVPRLRGKTLATSMRVMARRGCKLVKLSRRSSVPASARQRVVAQKPRPGRRIRRGGLTLTIAERAR